MTVVPVVDTPLSKLRAAGLRTLLLPVLALAGLVVMLVWGHPVVNKVLGGVYAIGGLVQGVQLVRSAPDVHSVTKEWWKALLAGVVLLVVILGLGLAGIATMVVGVLLVVVAGPLTVLGLALGIANLRVRPSEETSG